MCFAIPNATFPVKSCSDCTKYYCDALKFDCKTTLYRATCVQKNAVLTQIIIILILIWIFCLIVAAIVKAYLLPLIRKVMEKRRQQKLLKENQQIINSEQEE
ncbi:hypothetical protein ABK040_003297 [Willaertia magna]